MAASPLKLIIAGGGTGGHLFAGIAVAEEMAVRNPDNQVLFVGTSHGLEASLLDKLGFELRTIRIEGLAGRGVLMTIKNIPLIFLSIMQSFRIIKSFRPDIALGVGGYSSGPVIFAAWLAGIKTAIAEQNAQPGIANRILGMVAHKIFLTYPVTGSWFSPKKTVLTGNPVRRGFREGASGEVKQSETDRFFLLVFGGSQGAAAINEALIEALPYLRDMGLNMKIVHQTGLKGYQHVRMAYEEQGLDASVEPFIMNMPEMMRRADLIICRAGATSLAEITSLGKAAVLIPYPHATHDHQTKNARALSERGAAELVSPQQLSGKLLAATINKYYQDPVARLRLAANAAAAGKPDAARCIVDHLVAIAEER